MFRSFFNSKGNKGRCFALYCFDFNRNNTGFLLDLVFNYFSKSLNIKFIGFYDEKYKDNYGKSNLILEKIKWAKYNEIVNFSMDDEDIRNKNRTFGFEFNFTHPVIISICLSDQHTFFNVQEFISTIYPFFKPLYGFSYSVEIEQWAAAYALGDWQHLKGVSDKIMIAKEAIQSWAKNCEKIKEGYIRDIYTTNILSVKSLTNTINKKPLKELIEGENIGKLIQINEDLFIWELGQLALADIRAIVNPLIIK